MARTLDELDVQNPALATADFELTDETMTEETHASYATCLLIDWNAEFAELHDMVTRRIATKDRDWHYCEDVASEAITKAVAANGAGCWNGERVANGERNLSGWVWKVAQRLNVDGIRARARVELLSIDRPAGTTEEGSEIRLDYADRAIREVSSELANIDSDVSVVTLIARVGMPSNVRQTRVMSERMSRMLALRIAGIDAKDAGRTIGLDSDAASEKLSVRTASRARVLYQEMLGQNVARVGYSWLDTHTLASDATMSYRRTSRTGRVSTVVTVQSSEDDTTFLSTLVGYLSGTVAPYVAPEHAPNAINTISRAELRARAKALRAARVAAGAAIAHAAEQDSLVIRVDKDGNRSVWNGTAARIARNKVLAERSA